MNFTLMIDSMPALLRGTVVTIQLLAVTLILGMTLAIPLAILRMQRAPLLSWPVRAYIYFFRGTPLLVQIFLFYYGLAQFDAVRESIFWPWLRQPYVCALLTFVLHTAAYTANILRGAMEAVLAGEVEAARACGMRPAQVYRLILLPRAFRLALPAYSNEVIGMLKGTSLASTVTVMELTGVANTIVSQTFSPYEIFIAAALIYLAITFVLTRALALVEHHWSRHMRPADVPAATAGQEEAHA